LLVIVRQSQTMKLLFTKNVHFTKLIKINDRLKEFNFRRVSNASDPFFTVDVSDDRGNRIMFRMEKRDANNWRIVDDILPQWVSNNENKLHESIEEALH
jgi:hypothetical protein